MRRKPTAKAAADAQTPPGGDMEAMAQTLLNAPEPQQRLHAHGSRHRLTAKLFEVLCTDFEAHGAAAIRACREEQPQGYLRLIASLLPKELDSNDNGLDIFSDDEIDILANILAEHYARTQSGEGAAQESTTPAH